MSDTPLNAVIYARFSSHGQTEQSIDGQLRVCKEYAERENILVVGEYIDRGVSGTTDARPGFQRMIKDARKKQFEYVIVYKLDRFARHRYDSAIYKHKLKQNGVRLLSAMENIGDNPESIILEAVLEASAEYYSIDLSQKVKRGQRESLLKGKFPGGPILYGYKLEDKNVLINDEEALVIKHVFEEYAKGKSKKAIILELNNRGVRTRKGKKISMTTFQEALRNKKYIGVFTFAGETYPNIYPSLIKIDLFEKVQKMLTSVSHSPASSKARKDYLLRGKIFCGKCGSNMVGESGKGRQGNKYYYYACSAKKKLHTCNKKNEKKDFIEWYVVEQTLEYVLTPDRMKYIAKKVVASYDDEFGNYREKELIKRIAKIERDIDKCFNIMMQSDSDAILKRSEDKVKQLEIQKAVLDIDLVKLRLASSIKYSEGDILAWLKLFCNGDMMDDDFRRRIIDTFISSVYVYDDKFVIYYNLKDGNQVSYIENCEVLDEHDNTGSTAVRISNVTPHQRNERST